jgi:hypothetical protein
MMTEYRGQRREGKREKGMRSFDTANRHFSWYSFCLIVRVVYCMSVLWRLSSGKGVDLPPCCTVNNKKMEVLCTFQ